MATRQHAKNRQACAGGLNSACSAAWPAQSEGESESATSRGLKLFEELLPLPSRLHQVGGDRDRAGNRNPRFDDYCTLVLLFLFNPLIISLRGIQQAAKQNRAQRKLGCLRASLGSLSESVARCAPAPLGANTGFSELALPAPPALDGRLKAVRYRVFNRR